MGDSAPLAPSPDVLLLQVGDHALLFMQSRQQLYELNATAELIWRGISLGLGCDDLAAALTRSGLGGREAKAFVATAIEDWISGGQLITREASLALSQPPSAGRTLALDELTLRLDMFGGAWP